MITWKTSGFFSKKAHNIKAVMLALIIAVWLHLPSASAEICNRVVAKVNQNLITLYELNQKFRAMTGMDPVVLEHRNEKKFKETRLRILDLLIEEKIARGKIRELGIEVTPGQVDAAIEKIKANHFIDQEQLLLRLKEEELSYDTYREQIKNELERTRLINLEVKSKIIIREENIQAYYNAQIHQFTHEATVHLATIFIKFKKPADKAQRRSAMKKAEAVYEALNRGEAFEALAKKYSDWPGADEGGSLGFFKTSQLERDIRERISPLSAGEVTRPIVRPAGIQILRLLERKGGAQKPIEEVRDAIYAILFRQEVDKRYAVWIRELKESAYTEIVF